MADKPKKLIVRGRLVSNIWKLKENANDADKMQYSFNVILDEGEEKKIIKRRDEVCKEIFGKVKGAKFDDWTVREGDDEEFELSYERHYVNVKAGEGKFPAALVKRGGKQIDIEEGDDLLYPGANVALSLTMFGNKKKDKIPAFITLGIKAILFVEHGERLTDTVADDEFDDFESMENEDFDDEFDGEEEDEEDEF